MTNQITALNAELLAKRWPTAAAARMWLKRHARPAGELGCQIITTMDGARLEASTPEGQAAVEAIERQDATPLVELDDLIQQPAQVTPPPAIAAPADAGPAETAVCPREGDVILQIGKPMGRDTGLMHATDLAKRLRVEIIVRDHLGEVIKIASPKAPRAERPVREAAERAPRGKGKAAQAMLDLLVRPEGASLEELRVAAGWNAKPCAGHVRDIANANGRPWEKTEDKRFRIMEAA